jgi:hypothetical protein
MSSTLARCDLGPESLSVTMAALCVKARELELPATG